MATVLVSPFNVVNFPEGGGHFWVYMQYVQGLRQLGCEVFWLERFHSTGDATADAIMLAPFLDRMERFGLRGKTILYSSNSKNAEDGLPETYFGLSRRKRRPCSSAQTCCSIFTTRLLQDFYSGFAARH